MEQGRHLALRARNDYDILRTHRWILDVLAIKALPLSSNFFQHPIRGPDALAYDSRPDFRGETFTWILSGMFSMDPITWPVNSLEEHIEQ